MSNYLNIAIDLGTESVKAVYAFKKNDELEYGFIEDKNSLGTPFTSLALYSGAPQNKWIFGAEINHHDEYANIVRVKEMLYLLSSQNVGDSNYYYDYKEYPIFLFPKRADQPDIKNGMEALVERGYTFRATSTPKEMLEQFFKALFAECISPVVYRLLSENPEIEGVKYISVYPDPKNISDEYVNELERLIAHGAGLRDTSMVSSISAPKAIAVGAYVEKLIEATTYDDDRSKTMIFDIGEKDINVAKVDVKHGASGGEREISVCVDSADAQKHDISMGGADIDKCLGEFAKEKSSQIRDLNSGLKDAVLGYTSYRQQYHLLREVKGAKKFLSYSDMDLDDYAYITVEGDVNTDIKITKNDFLEAVFEREGSAGKEMVEKIVQELKESNNEDVVNVLLVGGSAASYSLREYVESACIEAELDRISVSVVENEENQKSEYFAAIGAAVLEPEGISLKVVSAYTYGTWRKQAKRNGAPGEMCKVFTIWINRGDEISAENYTCECSASLGYADAVYKYPYRLNPKTIIPEGADEEWFEYVEPLIIGAEDEREDKRLFEQAKRNGLVVIGSVDFKFAVRDRHGNIIPIERLVDYYQPCITSHVDSYGNFRGRRFHNCIYFKQGMRVDETGAIKPFYENNVEKNARLNANLYVRDNSNSYYAKDFVIEGNIEAFKAETN